MGWRLDDNEVAIIDEVGPCQDRVSGPALQLPCQLMVQSAAATSCLKTCVLWLQKLDSMGK